MLEPLNCRLRGSFCHAFAHYNYLSSGVLAISVPWAGTAATMVLTSNSDTDTWTEVVSQAADRPYHPGLPGLLHLAPTPCAHLHHLGLPGLLHLAPASLRWLSGAGAVETRDSPAKIDDIRKRSDILY